MTIWTNDTIELLRRKYPTEKNVVIANALHVSVCTLRWKARQLGLIKAKSRKQIFWTAENTAFLISNFPCRRTTDIAMNLGVSISSVRRKAHELGLEKAQESEDDVRVKETIISLYGKYSYRSIALRAGISKSTVFRIVHQLGLQMSPAERGRLKGRQLQKAFHYEQFCRLSGLSYRMNRTLGFDKRKMNIKYRLAADGYLVNHYDDVVYYTSLMERHPVRERNAEKMGLVFLEYPLSFKTKTYQEEALTSGNILNIPLMIIKGKITVVSPVRTGTSHNGHNWKVQDYVLETEEQNPQQCVFEAYGDNIDKFHIQKDDYVTVEFTMVANTGRDGHWFGNNRAVEVTKYEHQESLI